MRCACWDDDPSSNGPSPSWNCTVCGLAACGSRRSRDQGDHRRHARGRVFPRRRQRHRLRLRSDKDGHHLRRRRARKRGPVPSRRPGWLLAMGLASLMAWRAVRSWTASHPAHQARRRTAVSQRWRERKRPDGADHPLGLSSHRHRRQVMNRVSSSRLSPPYGCRVRTLAVTSDRRAEGPPGARQANLPGKRMLAQSNNLGARGAQGGIWSESHFAVSFRLIERMSDARAGQ